MSTLLQRIRWRTDWLVFLFALSLLGVAAIQSHRRSIEADAINASVNHTLAVLAAIERLEYATLSREAELRAYLLRGDRRFLDAISQLGGDATAALTQLQRLVADNPAQTQRVLETIEALAARDREIELRHATIDSDGLLVAQDEFLESGADVNVLLQQAITALGAAERDLLSQRTSDASRTNSKLRWSLLYGPGLALLILIAGFVLLRRQFTAAEKMSQQLATTNALQRAMLDGGGHMIIATNPDGVITLLNKEACDALGYVAADVVGLSTLELFHDSNEISARAKLLTDCLGEPVAADMAALIALPMRGQVDKAQWTYVGKSGARFPVQLTVTAIRSEAGELLGFMGIAEDISERVRAESEIRALNQSLEAKTKQLEESVRELESFTYSISHDLRAPLRHIHGYAQMLEEDGAEDLNAECRRYLRAIDDSSRRLGLLIDDLLTLSRLGKQQFEPRLLEMRSVVLTALNDVRGESALAGSIQIDELPAAYGDATLLRQVWVNLISNAIKYSARRGDEARIVVSANRSGDVVRYEISDNGIGFDMKYLDKLFGVFQRLHLQEDFEGTGVGLAIVQRIVKRLGGSVFAYGELGQGATFGFTLPLQGE